MRILIIGCGYVGVPLGAELARQGHEVFGLRRSAGSGEELRSAGIEPVLADITCPADLAAVKGPFDWVVNTVSSSKRGGDVYRGVYVEGTGNVLDWLAAEPPKKYVYAGSTSVYGQTDGSLVKEDSPTEPGTETGQVLVETERLLIEAARARNFPSVILRVAGIYGPGRGHLFQQLLRNEARLHGKGDRFLNMIHRDDVAGALMAALKYGRPGEIYNAADDEPVTEQHFFHWLADTLGKAMPAAAPEPAAGKRGRTNKRVCNRKLKMELGYSFKYPTFREGYNAEISRLEQEEMPG